MVVPYNPCGLCIDYGRERYDVDCRFFRDSDVTAKIRWYPCPPGAQTFPGEYTIHQSIIDRVGGLIDYHDGLGEVWDAPHKITHMAGVPGSGTGHYCGTLEMFAEGADYNPDVHTVYRQDGLPECCPGALPKGISWGGRAGPEIAGGVLWGGHSYQAGGWLRPACADVDAYPPWEYFAPPPAPLAMVPSLPAGPVAWLEISAGGPGDKTIRLYYEAYRAGTVTIYTGPGFRPCDTLTALYTGPAADVWTRDFGLVSPNILFIKVDTTPDDFGFIIIETTLP